MSIQLAILTALNACGDYLLPEITLLGDVNRLLPRPTSISTLREVCGDLEVKRQIVSVDDEDRGMQYRIAANGKARLRA